MTFFLEYGNTIIYTVLMAVISYVGVMIKKRLLRWLELLEEKEVVKTCVIAVNRIYKEKSDKEKYNILVENIETLLSKREIQLTDFEIKLLIAEVCETFDCGGIYGL